MNGYEFEREFVATLVELARFKGVKAAPLARTAWAHNKDAATKWRKIRNGMPPQELSIRDAFEMAYALGYSMAEICSLIAGKNLAKNIEKTLINK